MAGYGQALLLVALILASGWLLVRSRPARPGGKLARLTRWAGVSLLVMVLFCLLMAVLIWNAEIESRLYGH
ncbi:hypothetical protein [Paenibacillus sp. J31TS4]|uniref:hypothetical protein n=1 Tax=Paenibacillus sp. J31TS4 TaxID=2807195 RepID=UPI001BCBA9A0|nr:hypothetical protein [Paenibacillus sp. J31TS4]